MNTKLVLTRFFYLLSLCLWAGLNTANAQTCTGTVLNISAANPSQTGTTSSWQVPVGGPYRIKITAKGAKGGNGRWGVDETNLGGNGATMSGEFVVQSGQILDVNAGARGQNGRDAGGGGGGSGVRIQGSNILLIIAGGGGGGGGNGGNNPAAVGGVGLTSNNGPSGGAAGGKGGGGGGGYGSAGGNSTNVAYSGGGGGAGFTGTGGSASSGVGGGGFGGGGGGGHVCDITNNCFDGGDFSGGGGGGYSGGNGGGAWDGGSGGGSYNAGTNQSNTAGNNNGGGQVIIECLGTAAVLATATPTQPTCTSPTQGSVSIDLTGDLNGNTSGGVEYAIVSGNSFTGNPTFADITADPFNLTSGTGTTAGTYTVRVRLKYNPDVFVDNTYTIIPKLTGTIYVKANASGANNGTSWTDAFTSLQDALSIACSGAQIWVAKGTYYPTADETGNLSPTDARTKTFVMKNGVAIYGGFPNMGNPAFADRNWVSNVTTLSGDIGTAGSNSDNSRRVINNNFNANSPLTSSAILDGFTVEAGNANGGFPLNLGGGMWNAHASPTVRNCIFRNNSAVSGAAIFNDNSQASVTNCLFIGNSCTVAGAAMSNGGGTALAKVTNCTFYGNTGGSGTISNEVGATAITNCIVWGNTNGVSGGTVTYSIVQGGFIGTGNLNADPLFVNAAGGNFNLQACSPAIDLGTDAGAPSNDFDNNARVDAMTGSNIVDAGIYEYQSILTNDHRYYVNAASPVNGNGSSWGCAANDLQVALALAGDGSEIWVAAGTYKPTTGTDRNITFVMKNGVAIYGGFNGTETQLSQRNWVMNVTTLSGDIGTVGNISDNSYHVIFNDNNNLNSSAILDGFTIRNGNANEKFFPQNGGGGMCNSASSPTVVNCIFTGNSCLSFGGGMLNQFNSTTNVVNCIFSGNTSGGGGGGAYNHNYSTPSYTNCTFYGNTAFSGGAMFNKDNTTANITNCIIWGNSSSIGNDNSSPIVSYSIVQGGYAGTGNLNANPLFVNAAGGDFRLQQCSPAVDAGTNTNPPTNDFDGNVRPFNATGVSNADMGAYEYQSTYNFCAACAGNTGGIVYVNASAAGSNNGGTWANAFTDLQLALTLARTYPSCVSQIWVAAGTYKPTSGTDRNISFVMKNGVAIYGGFAGTEANLTDRNWAVNETILSGDIGNLNDNSDNSYNVINNGNSTQNTAVLNGFTITGGKANGPTFYSSVGGGILNNGDNGTCSPSFINCTIRQNEAGSGGAVCSTADNGNSSPTFVNCVFFDNSVILNGTFSKGGVMFATGGGTIVFTNCSFANNRALGRGGVFYISSNFGTPTLTIKNSIMWGNTAVVSGSQIDASGSSTVNLSNTILQGGLPAISVSSNTTINDNGNNSAADPLFVNAATGNLRLQPCSPAINAGDNTGISGTDLDNNPRIFNNGTVDLGAYEYQGNVVTQPTANASTTTAVICSGNTINLSANGGGKFSWAGPNNFSSTDQNPSFTGSSASYSGLYSVTVSNDNCPLTATATVSVQVNPNPVATPSSNSPICAGQTLQLSATAGGGTFSWQATSYSSNQQNPSRPSATTAMSGVYKLTVSNSSCTTTATISVQVVSQATAQISPSTTQSICQGQALNLTASGGSLYSWNGPGFSSTNAIASLNTSSTSNSGVYKVTVGTGICTATATVSVQIKSSISVSVGFAPICLVGNPLNLSASGGDAYRWRGPNSFSSTSASPNKAKTVAKDEGVYSVTVTGNGVCTATSTIRVFYGIGAGEISIANRSPYCKGGPISLTATAAGARSYQWTKQFGSVNFTGNPVTITTNAKTSDGGLYILFVTGENGCIEKQETLVTVSQVACVGTRLASEEVEEIDMEINAYPNPVTNILTVEVTLQKPSKLSLSLFNSIGKESGTWQLNEESTFHKTELNMSEIIGGVYLLQAQAGKQKVVKRVVKIQY